MPAGAAAAACPMPARRGASGSSVVHLHGGMTQANQRRLDENIAAPGQSVLDTYPNDQRAAMLWYHDHVMGVTRFNVYAGSLGLWIVRDERERELELPEDHRTSCHCCWPTGTSMTRRRPDGRSAAQDRS